MISLVDVIKDDAVKVKSHFDEYGDIYINMGVSLYGLCVGAVKGIYSPFVLPTTIRQIKEKINYHGNRLESCASREEALELITDTKEDRISAKKYMEGVTQGLMAGVYTLGIFAIAGMQEETPEFMGILAATNVVSYLYESYKRAKNKTDEEPKEPYLRLVK